MTRTFESGPAVPPEGPLADPPEIRERVGAPISPCTTPHSASAIEPVLLMNTQQITVSQLLSMLLGAVDADPAIGNYTVEADGCDCVGPAFGIRIDAASGEVLVAREGWTR